MNDLNTESDPNKNNGLVLLFLTRAFKSEQIAGKAADVNSEKLDNFFLPAKNNRNYFYQNLVPEDKDDIVFDDIEKFWNSFKEKYKSQSHTKIDDNFNGSLKQLIIKRNEDKIETNVFFFHHWFDRQLTHTSTDAIFHYIIKILEQIKINLKKDKIDDLRLILHNGDYIIDPVKGHKITRDDFKEELKVYYNEISIYNYSHSTGNPIWDKVLNDKDLYDKLCKNEEIKSYESFLLDLFDPNEITKRFVKFLNNLEEKYICKLTNDNSVELAEEVYKSISSKSETTDNHEWPPCKPYFLPFEILSDRELFENFCEKVIDKDIEPFQSRNKYKDSERFPIFFIITSSDISFHKNLRINNNQPLTEKFPHLSFIIDSHAGIAFINIPEDEIDPLKFVSQRVAEKLKLLSDEYGRGFFENRFEYLSLNFKLQTINNLSNTYTSSGAHGKFVIPFIYSNEVKEREDIKIADYLNFFFSKDEKGSKRVDGIRLRILLIDDKIGNGDECKANLISALLKLDFDKNKQDDVCWDTQNHPALIFPTNDKYDYEQIKSTTHDKIQIVAVKTLQIAQNLLANDQLRFDLIMMDYLLAHKQDNEGKELEEREYATEFWGEGGKQYFNLDRSDPLYETYDKIKANRGPMQRLWIFPITAFNQTFIDDLRNRGVRLIDYYWYLSRGADPINTPYLFIYTLNKFLMLMLEQAIFEYKDIIGFLKKSEERFDKIIRDNPSDLSTKLQHFFTTEYIFFINQYSTEEQVARDMDAGSLFAKYVHDNFIKKEENKLLFLISKEIRRFYHALAYGEGKDHLKTLERFHRLIDLLDVNLDKINKSDESKKDTDSKSSDILTKADLRKLKDSYIKAIDKRFQIT